MKYWSMSAISRYPELDDEVAAEMQRMGRAATLSRRGVDACGFVVQHLKPLETPNLVVIVNEGGPCRRLYLDYPEFDEWFGLERAGVIQDHIGMFFMVDALH